MPQVSILLPVRDEESFLPKTLASLQCQTLNDWELVAVDDGSTDQTPQILAKAASDDPRIRVLSQPPEGLVPALNHGLSACQADLVARMDGDDICHPQRLEKQVGFMQDNLHIDLVSCRIRLFPRPQLRGGMLAYEQWQNSLMTHEQIMQDRFVESPFAHPSVMFRRDLVLQAGGYRDLGWAEDYDLWLRLARAGARFARLPETLLFWNDRLRRLSRTSEYCSLEAFRACKIHDLQQGFLHKSDEVTLWGAGQEGKAWRSVLNAKNIQVIRWIEVDRRKIGQAIHGAPVIPIDKLCPNEGKILVTIGAKDARAQVRKRAAAKGLVEGTDFVCVT